MLRMAGLLTSMLVLTGLGMAEAQEADLVGDSAFGDFRQDRPGVRRLIRAGDLGAPDTGNVASNAPAGVARPDGVMPQVPEGFAVDLVATGIGNPRALRFAPNGDLFVANSAAGEVLVLGSGMGAPVQFAGSLELPYGIAFYPPTAPEWVYVAESSGLVRFPYEGGAGRANAPQRLFNDIPGSGHWTRDIAFSNDGRTLFYSVGSQSNVAQRIGPEPSGGLQAWVSSQPLGSAWGEEAGRAAVLAMQPDGTGRRVWATGLRNCAGMALHPVSDQPWCVVNERDALGDDVPFDYATSVADGAFYGWPWYYIGDNPDPRWQRAPRADLAGKVTIPDVLFQAHSAPLGIVFYEADAFGPDYRGDAFVALHGSWNRGSRTGYKVVRLEFEDGRPTGVYEDFVTGFVLADGSVWGRPVGVAVAPDGALYISDDGSGSIWRVSRR
ncbi:MAG: sorbosone dehydrogenase family protein [Devosia sp.]|nr:sorbosone dehydrogenase family protein [Devosia sp.]